MSKNSRKIKKPFWLTQPCPNWCMCKDSGHRKSHDGEDRHHISRWGKSVVLTTMDAVAHKRADAFPTLYTRPKVNVYVQQDYREISPRIVVEDMIDKVSSKYYTLSEAQRLIKLLQQAVDLAGRAA